MADQDTKEVFPQAMNNAWSVIPGRLLDTVSLFLYLVSWLFLLMIPWTTKFLLTIGAPDAKGYLLGVLFMMGIPLLFSLLSRFLAKGIASRDQGRIIAAAAVLLLGGIGLLAWIVYSWSPDIALIPSNVLTSGLAGLVLLMGFVLAKFRKG